MNELFGFYSFLAINGTEKRIKCHKTSRMRKAQQYKRIITYNLCVQLMYMMPISIHASELSVSPKVKGESHFLLLVVLPAIHSRLVCFSFLGGCGLYTPPSVTNTSRLPMSSTWALVQAVSCLSSMAALHMASPGLPVWSVHPFIFTVTPRTSTSLHTLFRRQDFPTMGQWDTFLPALGLPHAG